jgi:transcriptional antiterminator RfaH
MTAASSRHWYVVETQPHAENRAALNLRRQGFETYLPRYRKQRRHARRVEIVGTPLFPRYLFVAIDVATQRWRAIQSTFGVIRLVTNGDVPALIAGDVVDGLKKREDDQGFVHIGNNSVFASGQKIRVLDGAFEACLGLFEGIAESERVAILLDILGRKVRIVLDVASVVAA